MRDFLELENKHIVVTGATGGIGKATAIAAAEFGARVTLIGRREDKLSETVSMMPGDGHLPVVLDVSDIGAIEACVKEIVAKNGSVDGFVHCAGITKDSPIGSIKYEKLHELMLTNFYAFYEFVRVISKKNNFNRGLSIVGISSVNARVGSTAQTNYCASKAAINGTMRSMAKELAPKGIRVNTVLPGPTNTAMLKDYIVMRDGVQTPAGERTAEGGVSAAVNFAARNYLGMNEPSDVANAIVFLLSPAARMITGVELPVDAGYTSC